jgi:hypothetical protein
VKSLWNLLMCLQEMRLFSEFSSLSLLLKLFLTLDLFADCDCDNGDFVLSKEQSFDAPD